MTPWLLTAAVLLAGCGGGAPAPSPSASPPEPLPASRPLGILLTPSGSTFTLSLVSPAGEVVASTSGSLRPPPTDNTALPYPRVPLSASKGRLYYLDGEQSIAYLQADGSHGKVATLQPGSATLTGFAVDAVDNRLAYTLNQAHGSKLFVADLDGSSPRSIALDDWGQWIAVAWYAGTVVLGAPLGYSGMLDTTSNFVAYEFVDPATGVATNSIGKADNSLCRTFIGPAPDLERVVAISGDVCTMIDQELVVYDWKGKVRSTYGNQVGLQGTSLSPDGNKVYACCDTTASSNTPVLLSAAGPRALPHVGGGRGGWIDGSRVLVSSAPGGTAAVLDVDSGAVTQLSIAGQYVGALPGGLV